MSVNVGRSAWLNTGSRYVRSSIVKTPVAGRVAARAGNLDGDRQSDEDNHGGTGQAVYAYAREDAAWWEEVTGRELGPAAFGENLTLEGVNCSRALIGERWRVGTTELQVTAPRVPCFKLAALMGDPAFVRRFTKANRPGAYLSVVREGEIGAGDEVEVVSRPDHDVTVSLVSAALLLDHSLLPRLEPARAQLAPRFADFLESRLRSAR